MILFPLFATSVIDIGGKFAASIVDTGGNLLLVSTTPAVLVVHLHLRIFRKFSEKFEMTLVVFSGACGKLTHEKNLKQNTCIS
jgi:hypothetical protein